MDWLLGRNQEPDRMEILLAMVAHQGKTIEALVNEVKAMEQIIHKYYDYYDSEDKTIQVPEFIPPKKLHEQKAIDVDDSDIFRMGLDDFIKGCLIEESDNEVLSED